MSISAGLVGLPNVGKSTLFNAITKSSVPAENYPFCTIEPHHAHTLVPDPRVEHLKELFSSQKTIYPTIEFVDIAGLVKGAAKGEGLGNQFLNNIRTVNLVMHVVRCFEDENITNTQDAVDPIHAFNTIITELALKDLESIEKRQEKIKSLEKNKGLNAIQKKELEVEAQALTKIAELVTQEQYTAVFQTAQEHGIPFLKELLLAKPFMIIANINEDEAGGNKHQENKHVQRLREFFKEIPVVPVSAKLEGELSVMAEDEATEIRQMLDINDIGLHAVINTAYSHLGLITFFTCGPKEIHSWTIKKGTTIRNAAGEIHSDLERGFICAEIYNYKDLATHKTVQELKNKGLVRTEGADYVVTDGDIVNIRFNV